MTFQEVGRRVLNNLLQGILYVVPTAVTVFIVYKVLIVLYELIAFIIPDGTHPVLGIITIIVGLISFLITVGYIGSHFISQRLTILFDRFIEGTPLVKVIYFSVRDLLSTFVDKKKGLGKPVVVLMNKDQGIYRPGFITQKNLTELGLSEDFVAVYFPHSYAFSGELYITHKNNVQTVTSDASASEVMKFIVSGGVAKL